MRYIDLFKEDPWLVCYRGIIHKEDNPSKVEKKCLQALCSLHSQEKTRAVFLYQMLWCALLFTGLSASARCQQPRPCAFIHVPPLCAFDRQDCI